MTDPPQTRCRRSTRDSGSEDRTPRPRPSSRPTSSPPDQTCSLSQRPRRSSVQEDYRRTLRGRCSISRLRLSMRGEWVMGRGGNRGLPRISPTCLSDHGSSPSLTPCYSLPWYLRATRRGQWWGWWRIWSNRTSRSKRPRTGWSRENRGSARSWPGSTFGGGM